MYGKEEAFVRRTEETGDTILSSRPPTLDDFLVALAEAETPDDFLDKNERQQPAQARDPFAGWRE